MRAVSGSSEAKGTCMSDSSAPWHSAVDAIIPHPSAPRALLLAEHGGSYLPRVSSDDLPAVEADDIEDADLEQICRAL